MKNIIFLFFAIFILQGCATTKTAHLKRIDPGMSKAQVVENWGEPRSIQTAKNSAQRDNLTEKWYYFEQKDGKIKLPKRSVIFKNEKASHSFIF